MGLRKLKFCWRKLVPISKTLSHLSHLFLPASASCLPQEKHSCHSTMMLCFTMAKKQGSRPMLGANLWNHEPKHPIFSSYASFGVCPCVWATQEMMKHPEAKSTLGGWRCMGEGVLEWLCGTCLWSSTCSAWVSHSWLPPAAFLPKANSLSVTAKPLSAIWGETANNQGLVPSCADFCSDFQWSEENRHDWYCVQLYLFNLEGTFSFILKLYLLCAFGLMLPSLLWNDHDINNY